MARLAHLLDNQKRFVRDTAHQLRTPLAVLKDAGPVGPARRHGAGAGPAGDQRHGRARDRRWPTRCWRWPRSSSCASRPCAGLDLAEVVRAVALDLSPLIAEKDLDFEIDTVPRRCTHTNGCCANSRATCCTTPSSTAPQAARCRCAWPGTGACRPDPHRQRPGHPGRAARARCSSPSRRRRAQRLRPGPGHLPRDRAPLGGTIALENRDANRATRRVGRHRAAAAGGQSRP